MSFVPPSRPKILVVDDTPAMLRLLSHMLAEEYDVRTVASGAQALAAVRIDLPDIILLDVMMPEMSGFEVCQTLKQDASQQVRSIPIIFISALDETADKVSAFRAGGVDYITKPFQLEEVRARLHTHLTLRSLQRGLEQRVAERTRELECLNQTLQRFVPSEFLYYLQRTDLTQARLGDQVQRELTVFFSDLRNFTQLSEQLAAGDAFTYVNNYFGRMGPIIRQHQGFIDKYMGDGIMALFPLHPQDAVTAAIAMQQEVNRLNQENRARLPQVRVGMGLHTGLSVLGIVGEEERMQSTVISPAVNTASRLEALTKLYEVGIIASQPTYSRLPANITAQARLLDKVQVKGSEEPLVVYEIFGGEPAQARQLKLETRPAFEDGLQRYYQRDFAGAGERFEAVQAANPQDKVARIYLHRCRHHRDRGANVDWDGTFTM